MHQYTCAEARAVRQGPSRETEFDPRRVRRPVRRTQARGAGAKHATPGRAAKANARAPRPVLEQRSLEAARLPESWSEAGSPTLAALAAVEELEREVARVMQPVEAALNEAMLVRALLRAHLSPTPPPPHAL